MTTTTPSAPDEVVLAPCPFCGGKAEIVDAEEAGPDARVVCCTGCLASSKVIFALKEDVTDLLVEEWNRRASPQPAGVTAHGLHDDSEPVHAGLCRMMDDGGLPDDYRRIAAAAYARLPSPTDTRERVLEEAARVADEHSKARAASDLTTTEAAQLASRSISYAIRALKSKPTEAPVEDGWVRVPREEFGRLLATAHELTAYHIVTPETPDNELVHVCNGDLRKLDERVTAFALAASTKEE